MILYFKKECLAASELQPHFEKSVAFCIIIIIIIIDTAKNDAIMKLKSKTKGLYNMRKLLIKAGLIITVLYGLLNLLAIVDAQGNLGFIGELALSVDVYTWHIYGVFSIITLIIRLSSNSTEVDNGSREKWLDIQSVLHFIFILISFGGIYYLFENCF